MRERLLVSQGLDRVRPGSARSGQGSGNKCNTHHDELDDGDRHRVEGDQGQPRQICEEGSPQGIAHKAPRDHSKPDAGRAAQEADEDSFEAEQPEDFAATVTYPNGAYILINS